MFGWRNRCFRFCHNVQRFATKVQGESSPIIKQLDLNSSPESVLQKSGRTKLKRKLASDVSKLTVSQIGALETAEEDILELLEECLKSTSMLDVFPKYKQTSHVIQISKVTVNRDLSHVDVVWGSTIFEGFVDHVSETLGPHEGKKMKEKIFKKTNLQLQKKEGTFRTFLMQSIDFRRVPRIFFRPPGDEVIRDGQQQQHPIFEEWRNTVRQREEELKTWEETNKSTRVDLEIQDLVPQKKKKWVNVKDQATMTKKVQEKGKKTEEESEEEEGEESDSSTTSESENGRDSESSSDSNSDSESDSSAEDAGQTGSDENHSNKDETTKTKP